MICIYVAQPTRKMKYATLGSFREVMSLIMREEKRRTWRGVRQRKSEFWTNWRILNWLPREDASEKIDSLLTLLSILTKGGFKTGLDRSSSKRNDLIRILAFLNKLEMTFLFENSILIENNILITFKHGTRMMRKPFLLCGSKVIQNFHLEVYKYLTLSNLQFIWGFSLYI